MLAEIDWARKEVIRELRIPTASFRSDSAFMAPLINGVTHIGNRVFVAMWNFIAEIDYEKFAVVDAFSHPNMADLHGMSTDGKRLFVASTSLDAVLCFDAESFELIWRWGPDVPLLAGHKPASQRAFYESIPLFGDRLAERPLTFVEGEHRALHKSRSGFRRHHLNDVVWNPADGQLYVTTSHWFEELGGAVIRLNPETLEAEFVAPPDSFLGTHDVQFVDDRIVVTESRGDSAGWVTGAGEVVHQPLGQMPAFVRGLHWTGESFLTGFTRLRESSDPSWIVEFDRDFEREISRMDISGFFPTEQGCAIHAIAPAPKSA
ncbi:hypothetical protein MAIT1_00292 [Magnetofaba australis IT-1]|uniref:Uncharacterized protein n=1 Tax=Magnetofaba australis IT-1 TaxID=1434232 RepID=A0A1Y2KAJ8_9PROT|nr:hypothetical protein MAIT1_00292 [Magnetofaba australis IT-1]